MEKSAGEKAWDSLTSGASEEETETTEPVEAAPVEESAPAEAAPEAETQEAAPEARAARLRNPDGTYAETPKEKADARAAVQRAVKPAPSALAQGKKPEASEAIKPPNSMTAAEKEVFKTLSREAQQYLIRRDRDATVSHQRLAEAAKRGETYGQAIAPFEQGIRARGGEPVAYMRQLLQAEHMLQYGTPAQKAQVVHALLSNYGVDVEAVNALLQGQQPAPQAHQQQPQAPRGMTPEDVERLLLHRDAQREVSELAKGRPYLDSVRPRMAALMDAHHREGLSLTMEEAYDLACQADPDIRAALAAAKTKPATAVSPSKVRAAAGSLRSRPALPQNGAEKKSAGELAWEHLTSQG